MNEFVLSPPPFWFNICISYSCFFYFTPIPCYHPGTQLRQPSSSGRMEWSRRTWKTVWSYCCWSFQGSSHITKLQNSELSEKNKFRKQIRDSQHLLKTVNLVVQLDDYALMNLGLGGSLKNTSYRDQKFLCLNLSLQ